MGALADDITMSSEQSDYYYLIGTDAKVPFSIESPFQNTLSGTLQYSLTKNQNDGGFSISQTSTQSQSFPVSPGRSNHALTLASDTKADYDLSLLLLYSDKGKDYAAVLPPLSVHFVPEQKDIVQQKNTIRSTTSEATKSPSSPPPDPFDAMDQQMEQMRTEQQQLMQNLMSQSMSSGMNSRSQPAPKNPEQALQNNQMPSSSSALQQQLMEEGQQAKENKQKLAESLENDPLIQKQATDLKKEGYNQTSGKIVPTGPDRGEVALGFENKQGEKLSVTGNAENSQVTSLTAEKQGEIPVPPELASNATWNEHKEVLRNSSMTPASGSVTRTPHEISVAQNYTAPDGRNATLSARIVNGTVEEVILVQDEEFPLFWIAGILLVIILVILCAGVAWWYFATRKETDKENPEIELPLRNYREIVTEMMDDAERSYKSGNKKEGYTLLSQAVRVYLSHTYGNGDALTSEEILSGSSKVSVSENEPVHSLLRSCSLVEYAKKEPDDVRFFQMFADAKQIVDAEVAQS